MIRVVGKAGVTSKPVTGKPEALLTSGSQKSLWSWIDWIYYLEDKWGTSIVNRIYLVCMGVYLWIYGFMDLLFMDLWCTNTLKTGSQSHSLWPARYKKWNPRQMASLGWPHPLRQLVSHNCRAENESREVSLMASGPLLRRWCLLQCLLYILC